MVFSKPLINGNKSWIIRLVMTSLITALITSTGWLYATASQRITRDEVNLKIAKTKAEITCSLEALENRTNKRFDNLEERFDKTLDRFETAVNNAINRINQRLNTDE